VRIPDGPLIVFMSEPRSTPDEGRGFASAGQRALRIPDPRGPPATWTIEPTTARAPSFAAAANVACTSTDGDYLVAVVAGNRDHDGWLARWPLADAGAGDLANPQWWTGMAWVPEASLGEPPPTVIPDGASECSLHYDVPTQTWVYLWSRGFGGTTLAIRTAPAVTGPWSSYRDVLRPPESNVDNAFVYAGKAHPQLRGTDGSIAVTFANNSFTFADLFDPAREPTLYWPHVVRLSLTTR
jgi:hypothetical protein